MSRFRLVLAVLCAALPLTARSSLLAVLAADAEKPKEGKVSGLVLEKRDGSMMVKADGEKEAVKYVFGDGTDKKTLETLKTIYVAGREDLMYKLKDDVRQIVSVKKVVLKSKGTVTGEVLANHEWWIEVKPKDAVPERYAAKFPFDQHKDVTDKIKGLEKGDIVTITFVTDGERHRIETLQQKIKK
jgi:hypothetical protein